MLWPLNISGIAVATVLVILSAHVQLHGRSFAAAVPALTTNPSDSDNIPDGKFLPAIVGAAAAQYWPANGGVTKAELSFASAPVGMANPFIKALGWGIEEFTEDHRAHFEIVSDSDIRENVLKVTLHGSDGNGHKPSVTSAQRQEIKSPLDSDVWSRHLTSEPTEWKYEVTVKLSHKFTHAGDRFYHLFQVKFEKAKDGTPLVTVGTRLNSLGMYVAMTTGHDQRFMNFGPIAQFRGKWLRVQLLINAQTGPNATIQAKVYDAKSGELMHTSTRMKGRMDWNTSQVLRPKLGQYRSNANAEDTNVVYFDKLMIS